MAAASLPVLTRPYITVVAAGSAGVLAVTGVKVSPVPVVAVCMVAVDSAAPGWSLRTLTRLWSGIARLRTRRAAVSSIAVTLNSTTAPVTERRDLMVTPEKASA